MYFLERASLTGHFGSSGYDDILYIYVAWSSIPEEIEILNPKWLDDHPQALGSTQVT